MFICLKWTYFGWRHYEAFVSVICQSIEKRIYRNLITLSIVIQWKIHNSFCTPLFTISVYIQKSGNISLQMWTYSVEFPILFMKRAYLFVSVCVWVCCCLYYYYFVCRWQFIFFAIYISVITILFAPKQRTWVSFRFVRIRPQCDFVLFVYLLHNFILLLFISI